MTEAVGLFAGAGAFFRGVGFVVVTPRVWLRALVPVLTALALFAGLATLAVYEVAAHVRGWLVALLALPIILVALLIALALAQPLSGWALDGIVRAQRQELGLAPLPELPLGRAALSSLWASLLALAVGTPVLVVLTVIGWSFPPAAVVTVPVKVVIGALLLGWNLIDYPLAMHGAGLGARIRWAGRHFSALLGFGLAASALFAVPGLGLIALPCGVAGAARMLGMPQPARPRAQLQGASTAPQTPRGPVS